ncbi:MAG: sigma-70 family RNA polymerase sigma factor [Candidatus Kapabacteria bacterium]|jgi:RNA polymerase sigma-70 factor (ECF subfamily)|nr:sigma-70 family RNA polymerase sigma factor [Candidatus Kapabacteria bacterium]
MSQVKELRHLPDKELLVMLNEKKEYKNSVITVLYSRHYKEILRVCKNKYLRVNGIEDLVQEAYYIFLKKIEENKKFTSFKTYILSVVHYLVLNHLKSNNEKHKPIIAGNLDKEYYRYCDEQHHDAEVNEYDIAESIAALNSCTEEEKHLLELRFIEGFSLKEIADLHSTPVFTVQKRFYRLKKKLQSLRESRS